MELNYIHREILKHKVISLNLAIEPVFKSFGKVSKIKDPQKYFILCILNKIYSINVSMENIIFTNDIFLSIYIYRYIYELYIKVFYIFSTESSGEVVKRINRFFVNNIPEIHECEKKLNRGLVPPEVTKNHRIKYKKICDFVHPNFNSLMLHIDKDHNQQFKFLVPNINLSVWLLVDLVRFFLKNNLIEGVTDEKLSNIQKID